MSVIGTDPKTYTVPIVVRPICNNPSCNHPCEVGLSKVPIDLQVEPRELLQFMDASDSVQDRYVREVFSCKSIRAEPVEFINVQKILFQETASFVDGLDNASFENRYGAFMYKDIRLTPTQKYSFEACRVTDPRNQQNFYVIRSAEAVDKCNSCLDQSGIDYFQQISAERFN